MSKYQLNRHWIEKNQGNPIWFFETINKISKFTSVALILLSQNNIYSMTIKLNRLIKNRRTNTDYIARNKKRDTTADPIEKRRMQREL